MAGLLDWMTTPQGIGLLSAVAGGMAGARRGQPVNSVGRGLVTGLSGYASAQDQIKRDEENALTKQYRELQMQQLQRQIETQKAQQAWKAGLPNVMQPKLTGSTEQGKMLAEQNAAFGQEGVPDLIESAQYAQPDAPLNMNYGVDQKAVQQYMMQPDSPYLDKMIEQQIMPPETVVVGRTLKNKKTGETIGYDETWKEEQAASREQRRADLELRLQDQQLSREQSMALRRELAALSAGQRQDALDLRRDEITSKREAKQETANLTKQSQIASFDTMLGTLDRLGKHPGLSRSVGVMGVLPTMPGSDSANFQAELNTFQSQAFVPMVAQLKGMGALSDAEGKKLTAAVGALDPKMGEKAFRESVGRITSEMEAARARVSGQSTRKPQGQSGAYQEYLSAYKQAKTPEQRQAITARARQLGVVK